MKNYLVSAGHVSPAYRIDNSLIAVKGEPGNYSVNIPRFGYVCGFNSPEAALRDILLANGCENIVIHEA